MNKNKALWKKSKKIILRGNSLFSKNPENYSKDWPAYFDRAKGCRIWSIDKKKYTDFSYMGIGTNILGYSNSKIDNYVKKIINKGTMSTLNCVEEVYLSQKLIKMHKWSSMCKFARTGAEASAIAIRIGRIYSKKNKIAICGYHGWHDWYLSVNLKGKKRLDTHLFKNLNTDGVDKNLKNSSVAFKHNDLDSFKKMVRENKDIGVVIMEVERFEEVKKDFLKYIRDYTKKNKITLIFDECTSGFRQTFGGLHLKYKINPDICILGKALGNGYPINAVIGTKQVMNKAANSFISSTFWSDRIGPAAALKTLEIMEKERSWIRLKTLGNFFKKNFKLILNKHSVSGNIIGTGSLLKFKIDKLNDNLLKRFFVNEMLKKGMLASNVIYLSTAHTEILLKRYLTAIDKAVYKLKIMKRI
ncbi:aminotransferase class III-fold pyridoxal phosphate-dependent enzyme [Candidatus Pelagibacter sp.]|nr:aminotransferase class III-fold pyridoxal phosphate-dependent enzyme [Candidatus Pelagibacter sp.]